MSSDSGEGYLARVAAAETLRAFGNEAFAAKEYQRADEKYSKVGKQRGDFVNRRKRKHLEASRSPFDSHEHDTLKVSLHPRMFRRSGTWIRSTLARRR